MSSQPTWDDVMRTLADIANPEPARTVPIEPEESDSTEPASGNMRDCYICGCRLDMPEHMIYRRASARYVLSTCMPCADQYILDT